MMDELSILEPSDEKVLCPMEGRITSSTYLKSDPIESFPSVKTSFSNSAKIKYSNKSRGMKNYHYFVPQCKSSMMENPNLCFFPFPKKARRRFFLRTKYGRQKMHKRNTWVKLLNLKTEPSVHMKVCSEHFTVGDCFQGARRKILRSYAVPSKNLPEISKGVQDNARQLKTPSSRRKQADCPESSRRHSVRLSIGRLGLKRAQKGLKPTIISSIRAVKGARQSSARRARALRGWGTIDVQPLEDFIQRMEPTTNRFKSQIQNDPTMSRFDIVASREEDLQQKTGMKNYTCCVLQCKSTEMENPNLLFFPFPKPSKKHVFLRTKYGKQKMWKRKKWIELLNLETEPSVHMKVCSEHFTESDFFQRKGDKKLRFSAVPSINLPKISHEVQDSVSQLKTSTSNGKIEMSSLDQDGEVACPGSSRRQGAIYVRPMEDLLETMEPTTHRFKPKVVQNECTMRTLDIARRREDLLQVDSHKSIDLLRKSLVGHVIRTKGNTFRINECTIRLTKEGQDIEENGTLVDRTESSCSLSLDPLLKSERIQGPREISNIAKSTDCVFTEILPDDSGDININTSKKSENLESEKTPYEFGEDSKVLLHELPENLVEAVQKDCTVKEPTKSHVERIQYPNDMLEINEFPKIPPESTLMKISKNSKFQIGKNIFTTTKVCHKSPKAIQDPLEFECDACNKRFDLYQRWRYHRKHCECKTENSYVYKDTCIATCSECLEILRNSRELEYHLLIHHRIVLKKDNYPCDECTKKFITYKSLMYHHRTVHNLATIEDVIVKFKCEYCNKLFSLNSYNDIHPIECAKLKQREREGNYNTSSDVVLKKLTATVSKPTKRKPPLILNGDYNIQRKMLKLVKQSSILEGSYGTVSKLETLEGVNDGPYEIFIVNLVE